MSKKEEKEYEEYESLKNSKFKQQKLPGWRPVPSMLRTIIIYFGFGIVFVGLGVLILLFSNDIVEHKDNYCKNPKEKTCEITFNIDKTMKPNIMVYYQIDGFYQNHRRYMKSKSEKQLEGNDISYKEAEVCEPARTNRQMGKKYSYISEENNQKELKLDDVAIPCGLMAKSFFNDTFEFKFKLNNVDLNDKKVNEKNIARKSDIEKYNRNIDPERQWHDLTDEHLMVWMRPSPLPNFRKLWGRIEQELEEGTEITVTIKNNYNVSLLFSPNATKYLIISTVNSFGGKNPFLAVGCLILGGASLILGIVFLIGFKMRAKKEK